MRVVAILFVALLAGCAASPEKVNRVAAEEAARLQAPSVPLSSFSDFRLEPMVFSPEIRAEPKKVAEGQEFEQNLKNRLLPLFAEWKPSAASGNGSLVVKTELKGLRIVSGGARFWAGALVGDSFLDMDLILIDAGSGDEISRNRIYRNAGSMAGAWSIGKSDQNLDEYVVSIVEKYLRDSF